MKKRIKQKLKLLKKGPNKIERLFNEANGRGIVKINYNDKQLVMIKEEEYKKMLASIEESTWLINKLASEVIS